MAEYTKNYNLEKQQGNEYISIEGLNENFDKIDTALGNSAKFEKASGTGTAITLNGFVLEDGASKTFIVSANNNGVATTINGKKLYKSGTTTSPSLIACKAATVWYSQANDCLYTAGGGDADTLGGISSDAFVEKSVILPDKIDLNTAVTTGFYTLPENPVNAPSGAQYGQLIVSRNAGSISQIVISISVNKMFYRAGTPVDTGGTGSWGTWQEISVSGHKHTNLVEKSIALPDGADLNGIIETGFYRLNASPMNSPVPASYSQLIVSRGGDTISQILITYSSPRMFYRAGTINPGAGNFTSIPWREVAVNGLSPTFPSIELSGGTPYIDFHFNSSTTDYTTRLIESLTGVLQLIGTPSDIGTSQLRNIQAGSVDLVAGSSSMLSGHIYIVYE